MFKNVSNNPELVQITAWRQPGDRPLSVAMLFSLLKYICVNRPQWIYRNVFIWIELTLNSHCKFDLVPLDMHYCRNHNGLMDQRVKSIIVDGYTCYPAILRTFYCCNTSSINKHIPWRTIASHANRPWNSNNWRVELSAYTLKSNKLISHNTK